MAQPLQIGAHLASPRKGYVHHGIYAGNGRVIHYAGFARALRRGPVEEVPLERFTRGRAFQVRVHATPQFDGSAAVERARTRLGEDRYRFWSNNCEHFVEWCIAGTSRSPQVEVWRSRFGRAWRAFGAPLSLLARPAETMLALRRR
jgi:hypothetical protein